MTPETSSDYFRRCLTALGQSAADAERVAIWCYDNPPRKALPKVSGERNRHVYIPAILADSLDMAASAISNGDRTIGSRDALAAAALTLFIKDYFPEPYDFFQRYTDERAGIETRLKELRRNEPTLQPQEEMP